MRQFIRGHGTITVPSVACDSRSPAAHDRVPTNGYFVHVRVEELQSLAAAGRKGGKLTDLRVPTRAPDAPSLRLAVTLRAGHHVNESVLADQADLSLMCSPEQHECPAAGSAIFGCSYSLSASTK